MTQPTGGLRRRFIRANLYNMLYEALDTLGWFGAGRQHQPITFLSEPVDSNEPIAYNTIAIADSNETDMDWELGSRLAEHRVTFYIDFFAEKDSLGLHVSGDIKDILEGRMDSIGRIDPSFAVYDLTFATPPYLFTCQIEHVMRDRAVTWSKPHQKYWYALRFDVVDYYGSEIE